MAGRDPPSSRIIRYPFERGLNRRPRNTWANKDQKEHKFQNGTCAFFAQADLRFVNDFIVSCHQHV